MFNRRKKTQSRVMTGLLTAVGAVGAFFGGRALMGWLRTRSRERSYQQEYRMEYDTGMEEDSAGSEFPANLGTQPQTMPTSGVTATGRSEVGQNFQDSFASRDRFADQGAGEHARMEEQETIPATGAASAPAADRTEPARPAERGGVETTEPIPVGSLVGPLIVHLLIFHNMINLLRQRQQTQASSGVNTPDVRAGGADAVSSLEAQIPEFDHAALVQGSLQARMVQLMERMRDALQNTDYSEEQLYKISDELRPQVCKLLDLIHQARQDDVTGFEDVQKAYHC